MRKILALGVVLTAFIAMTSFSANAQQRENRDSLGNIVRGPYETNKAWDNWFIGVGGGVNLLEDGASSFKTKIGVAVDAYVGKWFTPTIGARVGYTGITGQAKTSYQNAFTTGVDGDMYKMKLNSTYVHGDLMWNFSNAVSGYREDRFWDFIPYVSAGWLRSANTEGSSVKTDQIAAGVGLYNTLRLGRRVDITLDIRQLIYKGTYMGQSGGVASQTSAMLGLNFNLGKTKFKRATTIPDGSAVYAIASVNDLKNKASQLADENEALKDENGALKKENAALKDENADLKDQLANAGDGKLDVTPAAVYFTIGQTTLSNAELSHLDFYVQNVIEQDSEATFVLTGYADKDTGGKQRNQYLSQKRVDYVVDILKNEYNIDEDRLIVKAVGADSTYNEDHVELNRCVVLEYAE